MFSRISLILIVALAAILWQVLDANPALFAYDLLVSDNRRYSHTFTNKTIWITGASSGIGAAMACELVKAQASHVILSARRVDKLQQVAEKCRHEHGDSTRLSILEYDALADSTNTTVDSALLLTENSGIDVLILNAGIYQLSPALETCIKTTSKLMRVNFQAPVALATTLMLRDNWKQRGHGHLIVVTSLVARGAQSLTSSYAASKAALRNYFFTLSTEEWSWLQVNIALPGATDTQLWNSLDSTTEKERAPLYVKMSPQRVARLILTGSSGWYWLFYETFISKPIGLIWIYLSIYTPTLFHWFIHFVGTIRVQLWRINESDTLDILTLLSSGIKLLWTGRV